MRIAVVCKGRRAFRVASTLVDRIFSNAHPSIQLDQLREFSRVDGKDFLAWKDCPNVAKRQALRVHGFSEFPDAKATRRAILLLERILRPPPDLIVFVRDADGDMNRKAGIKRATAAASIHIAVGVAQPMIEAWLLIAYGCHGNTPSDAHQDLARRLSFDPCRESHRLNGKPGELRCVKTVFDQLTTENDALEALRMSPLLKLKSRGDAVSLATFISEIEEYLHSRGR
jgi:hypothetical protein